MLWATVELQGEFVVQLVERGNVNDVYILQRHPSISITFPSMPNYVNIRNRGSVLLCSTTIRAYQCPCVSNVCTVCVYKQKHQRPGNINVLVPDKQLRISHKHKQNTFITFINYGTFGPCVTMVLNTGKPWSSWYFYINHEMKEISNLGVLKS